MHIYLDVCNFNDKDVEYEWKKIFENNPELTYFSSYEFNKTFLKFFKKNSKRKNMELTLVRAKYETGETIMFLPLCKNHHRYYLIWDYSSVPFCDVIGKKELTDEDYDLILKNLPDAVGNSTVCFTKMNPNSKFSVYLEDRYTHYKKKYLIEVDLYDSYSVFTEMLTDRTKQLIDDSRAKLKFRQKQFKTVFFQSRSLPSKVKNDMFYIYYKNSDLFKKLKNKKHDSENTISIKLKKSDRNFLALSYTKNIPIAFVAGFTENEKLYIVRTGYKRNGEVYSEDVLILCDLVKYCIENTGIKTLIFVSDDVKYREDLGGTPLSAYSYEVKL